MAKVIGLGGSFFRVPDPEATSACYRAHLALAPLSEHQYDSIESRLGTEQMNQLITLLDQLANIERNQ